MLKRNLRALFDRAMQPYRAQMEQQFRELKHAEGTSAATKISQKALFHRYRQMAANGMPPRLTETGFRNFSQFEEDGKLLFIFATLGISSGDFLDIGAADGINSNCANLALNFGWRGTFIDGDPGNVSRGKRFYETHPDTWAYPPTFVEAMVRRENINEILTDAGVPFELDLMSIDIDGNDYWVWEAIEVVDPKVVIIETHIEFGLRSIVVPYDPDYVYPGKSPDYHGASPVAMAKLAEKKGYRLVGANDYGFNTIYVKRGLAEDLIPTIPVERVLDHPRNKARAALFKPIEDWDYVEV